MPSQPLVASIALLPFCSIVDIHCWAKVISLLNVFIAWYCDFLWWYSAWFLWKPLNWLVARHFGQQEVLSQIINIYKLVYIEFIKLAVAFDEPTHQDINIHHYKNFIITRPWPNNYSLKKFKKFETTLSKIFMIKVFNQVLVVLN